MSDSGKKTLGLGGSRPSSVKQSFSHGRTKNVVVETKRKRVVVPKPGAAGAAAKPAGGAKPSAKPDVSKRPAGISEAEMQRRLAALQAAKAREVEEEAERAEQERQAAEERERRRAEAEAKEREEREREEALKAKAEEDERKKREAAEAEARAKAEAAQPKQEERRPAPAAAKPAPSSPRKVDRERDDRRDNRNSIKRPPPRL